MVDFDATLGVGLVNHRRIASSHLHRIRSMNNECIESTQTL